MEFTREFLEDGVAHLAGRFDADTTLTPAVAGLLAALALRYILWPAVRATAAGGYRALRWCVRLALPKPDPFMALVRKFVADRQAMLVTGDKEQGHGANALLHGTAGTAWLHLTASGAVADVRRLEVGACRDDVWPLLTDDERRWATLTIVDAVRAARERERRSRRVAAVVKATTPAKWDYPVATMSTTADVRAAYEAWAKNHG